MYSLKQVQIRRSAVAALAIIAGAALAAAPTVAQDVSATVVAETGGDDLTLLLGDLTGAFGTGSIAPVVSVQTYLISFEAVDGSDQIYAFAPAVGLRARSTSGFLQGTVGYSMQSGEGGPAFFGGGTDGVTTGVHAEYWGTGQYGLQGIGAYNWGAGYLWSRGRGTVRVADVDDGDIQLGAEAVWQGDLESDAPAGGYEALQLGPVFRWVTPRLAAGVSGGWKSIEPAEDDTWYLHLELTVPINFGGAR